MQPILVYQRFMHCEDSDTRNAAASCCERSVGNLFQLPSPDAIYSRDEEKNGDLGGFPDLFGFAHGPHAAVERVIGGRKRPG